VLSLIRAKCLPILLYATEACPLLSHNRSSYEFTVTRLFMKLFRTTLPAVVKCCQLAINFLPVHSQLDIRTAHFLQKYIASQNSLCYLCVDRLSSSIPIYHIMSVKYILNCSIY